MFHRNAFLNRLVEQIVAGGDFSSRAGPRCVLPGQGSTAAGAEQIADIPSSGCPHGFLPGQVSTASPGLDHVDEHLPNSAEWVQFLDAATGKPYYPAHRQIVFELSFCRPE